MKFLITLLAVAIAVVCPFVALKKLAEIPKDPEPPKEVPGIVVNVQEDGTFVATAELKSTATTVVGPGEATTEVADVTAPAVPVAVPSVGQEILP